MKNKAPLALIELAVMILVFALAAALCLQAFAWSDTTSVGIRNRDAAVLQAQNIAEVTKACGGDFAEAAALLGGEYLDSGLAVYFDSRWQTVAAADAAFCAKLTETETEELLLGRGDISVTDTDGEQVFSISVCWQEVNKDGR